MMSPTRLLAPMPITTDTIPADASRADGSIPKSTKQRNTTKKTVI